MSRTILIEMTTSTSPLPSISEPDAEVPVSTTKMALDCPEILHAIGEWLPVFSYTCRVDSNFVFKPQILLTCCLVSKYWRKILTPLLWRFDDTKALRMVPQEVLEKYSEHVRTYIGMTDKWHPHLYKPPPMHTQLRLLTMGEGVKTGEIAMRMIGTNCNLRMISICKVRLFEQLNKNNASDNEGGEGSSDTTGQDEGNGFNENIHSLTNPLGHLQTTLEDLCVDQVCFQGMELYYLLQSVAKGSLRTLKLNLLSGTFDLQDLVFESLTRLYLLLDNKCGLHEIVGRSPVLEHFELSGPTNVADACSYEPLVHILSGTQPKETPRQRGDRLRAGGPPPKQWLRPYIKTLRLHGPHLRKRQDNAEEMGNDVMFLELIRGCGARYNGVNDMVHPGSLQELDLPLWFVDDLVWRAIEAISLSLQVLKLTILRGREGLPAWKHERQGRVLRRILQSCSKLRVLEFWDQNGDEDISVIMAGMIGERGVGCRDSGDNNNNDDTGTNSENYRGYEANRVPKVEALDCPELESLTLKSIRKTHIHNLSEEEGEQRYFNDDEDNGSVNGNSAGPWVMVKQKWDATLKDGTDILLDSRWNSFELFEDVVEDIGQENEGDKLLRRFLRQISPSRKLKELQLGQLRFTRIV